MVSVVTKDIQQSVTTDETTETQRDKYIQVEDPSSPPLVNLSSQPLPESLLLPESDLEKNPLIEPPANLLVEEENYDDFINPTDAFPFISIPTMTEEQEAAANLFLNEVILNSAEKEMEIIAEKVISEPYQEIVEIVEVY